MSEDDFFFCPDRYGGVPQSSLTNDKISPCKSSQPRRIPEPPPVTHGNPYFLEIDEFLVSVVNFSDEDGPHVYLKIASPDPSKRVPRSLVEIVAKFMYGEHLLDHLYPIAPESRVFGELCTEIYGAPYSRLEEKTKFEYTGQVECKRCGYREMINPPPKQCPRCGGEWKRVWRERVVYEPRDQQSLFNAQEYRTSWRPPAYVPETPSSSKPEDDQEKPELKQEYRTSWRPPAYVPETPSSSRPKNVQEPSFSASLPATSFQNYFNTHDNLNDSLPRDSPILQPPQVQQLITSGTIHFFRTNDRDDLFDYVAETYNEYLNSDENKYPFLQPIVKGQTPLEDLYDNSVDTLRHNSTLELPGFPPHDYDDLVKLVNILALGERGWIGQDLYKTLVRRIHDEISRVYPFLAKTCEQKNDERGILFAGESSSQEKIHKNSLALKREDIPKKKRSYFVIMEIFNNPPLDHNNLNDFHKIINCLKNQLKKWG